MKEQEKVNEIPTIQTQEYGEVQVFGAASAFESPVIVEKAVVIRLASLLPTANFKVIKNDFREDLRKVNNMEEFVKLLQTELSFHRTVNIIKDATIAETPSVSNIVGKIDLNDKITSQTDPWGSEQVV